MRLIDADELKNRKIVIDYDEVEDTFDDGLLFVTDLIDKSPTVDAVPVCRCKDCKYGKKYNETQYQCDRFYGEWFEDDDFCSYGERKGGDGDE